MHSVCIFIYLSMYTVNLNRIETVLKCTPGCTWRQHSSTLGDRNRVNLKVYLEIAFQHTWRWRLCKLKDPLGGGDRANLEVYLEGP